MKKLYAAILASLTPVISQAEIVDYMHFQIDTETRAISPLLLTGKISNEGSLYLTKISKTTKQADLSESLELVQIVAPGIYLAKGDFGEIHGDAFEWAVKYLPEMKLTERLQKSVSRKIIADIGPRDAYIVVMANAKKNTKEQFKQFLIAHEIKANINIHSKSSSILLELNTGELTTVLSSDLVINVSESSLDNVSETLTIDSVISRAAHGTTPLSSFDESCNSVGHYTGQGVNIAVWDSGFRESHMAFQNDDGTDNFVMQRQQTIARSSYEGISLSKSQLGNGGDFNALGHGTVVFSVIGSDGISASSSDIHRCTTGPTPNANFLLGEWHKLGDLVAGRLSWSVGETSLSDAVAELAGPLRTPIQVGSKNFSIPHYEILTRTVDGIEQTYTGDAIADSNRYNSIAREVDEIVRANDILMVTPTGNRGGSDPDDGRSTMQPAYAKNGVAVGSIHFNRSTDKSDHTWGFGPTNTLSSVKMITPDNRVKPDLIAEHCYNTAVASSDTSINLASQAVCGVSLAAPYVAGQFGILYQMWAEGAIHGNDDGEGGSLAVGEVAEAFSNRPTTSMAKAIMINTAERYPLTQFEQNTQGWGVANVENITMAQNAVRSNVSAYPFAKELPLVHDALLGGSRSLPHGDRYDQANAGINHATQGAYYIDVKPGTLELNVTMAWIDRPAVTNAQNALVLDFNLYAYRYVDGSVTHQYAGNNFGNDYYSLLGTSGVERDNRNNIENIFIKNPVPGLYKLFIDPRNIGLDSENASLVATCDGGSCAEIILASTYNPFLKVSGQRPWRHMFGYKGTPSLGTGPSAGPAGQMDHQGNSNYFYFEASNYSGMGSDFTQTYDDAILEFNEGYINPKKWILDFDMHKWGGNQGVLYVEYYYPDRDSWVPIWHNVSAANKNEWQHVSLNLAGWASHHADNSQNGKTKYRIRYDHQNGWKGDIAIGNIVLNPNYNYIN